MNANELADKLDKSQAWMDSLHNQYKNGFGKYCALPKEVATMLRQQQAEIETLKKDNKELHAIAQRMAMAESDARKSLQWMKDVEAMGSCAHTELTDEEIIEVWNVLEDTHSAEHDAKVFARAILRKAQEK